MLKKSIGLVLIYMFLLSSSTFATTVLLSDSFEYADDSALSMAWPQDQGTGATLDTTVMHSGDKSVLFVADQSPDTVGKWLFGQNTKKDNVELSLWWYHNYADGYDAYNSYVQFGTSDADRSMIICTNYREIEVQKNGTTGRTYMKFDTGWNELKVIFDDEDNAEIYFNDTYLSTNSVAGGLGYLRFGKSWTIADDRQAAFDDLAVIAVPEPATMTLLCLGSLVIFRNKKD
jgi:hypothetical protein